MVWTRSRYTTLLVENLGVWSPLTYLSLPSVFQAPKWYVVFISPFGTLTDTFCVVHHSTSSRRSTGRCPLIPHMVTIQSGSISCHPLANLCRLGMLRRCCLCRETFELFGGICRNMRGRNRHPSGRLQGI